MDTKIFPLWHNGEGVARCWLLIPPPRLWNIAKRNHAHARLSILLFRSPGVSHRFTMRSFFRGRVGQRGCLSRPGSAWIFFVDYPRYISLLETYQGQSQAWYLYQVALHQLRKWYWILYRPLRTRTRYRSSKMYHEHTIDTLSQNSFWNFCSTELVQVHKIVLCIIVKCTYSIKVLPR